MEPAATHEPGRDPEVRARAAELKRAGWSLRKIARDVGVSPERVRQWLAVDGVVVENPSAMLRQSRTADARRLAGEGLGVPAIAERLGVTRVTVRAYLGEDAAVGSGAASRWPLELMLERGRAWVEEFGRPPTSTEWDASALRSGGDADALARWLEGDWPPAKRVVERFGSWRAFVRALGFVPLPAGWRYAVDENGHVLVSPEGERLVATCWGSPPKPESEVRR